MLTPLPHPYGIIATVAAFVMMALVAGIGGMLVASAWRGRLLGWAPTCMKCRFDLRASASDLPSKCPECGHLLAGAVDVGPRSLRRGQMVMGVVLLIAGVALAVGAPLGVARSINNWLLSQRSLESFAGALDAGDQRAWRLALDRIRVGKPSTDDVESLLRRVLSNIARNGAVTIAERSALSTLSQSPAAPDDLRSRVLDVIASIPSALRVVSAADRITPGSTFAVNASVSEWPTLQGLTLQVKVAEVLDPTGRPMRELLPPTSGDFTRHPRSMINTRLVRAPGMAGQFIMRAVVEVRAINEAGTVVWERRIESLVPIRVEAAPLP